MLLTRKKTDNYMDKEHTLEFTISNISGSIELSEAEPRRKSIQTVEDYRKENKLSIELLKAATSGVRSIHSFPDLWPEHSKLYDEDVRSKLDFFQIPPPIKFLTSLEAAANADDAITKNREIN